MFATTTYGSTTGSYTDSVYVDPLVTLGVYASSDGGNTWTLQKQAQNAAWDIILDPANPSTVYAAVDGAVYESKDGGASWNQLTGGLPSSDKVGRINLGISISSHLTLYAALQYFDGSSNGIGRLYKTTDGGINWSMLNTPEPSRSGETGFCGGQCDYDLVVAVDPTDPNTIYLGGLDMYRSTDGGITWLDFGGNTTPNRIHTDQHALAFSPASHSLVYIGNDGGIWSSTNANTCSPDTCWTSLNAGLGIAQFYSIAVDPKDSSHLLGGTQDNGCLSHRGSSSTWTEDNNCGDGGWTAFDPLNPQIMYEATQWSEYTGGSDFLFRSNDGGAGWTPIEHGLVAGDTANFLVPLAMDQSNSSTLYLGTTNLYKTTSRGDQWFNPSPGLSFPTPKHCYDGDCISAITVAPSSSNYVYVGTTMGKVFVSMDGANHFAQSVSDKLPANVPVTYFAVDPATPTKVYASFSGFGNGHVFSSSDGGASWNDISSNLPDYPANSIALNADGTGIFVGTDRGVYVSVNGGQRWGVLGMGLPRVPVMDLKFASDGKLWAATFGRGAWVYTSKILVTFGNVSTGATITIDGTSYNGTSLSSMVFEWDPGSTHTLQVNQTELGSPGVRYIFVKWNDGSTDLTRTITATSLGDLSPVFKTQYQLTVSSDYDNPQGSGWYDEGATATYSVSSPTPLPGILGILGAKATFLRWNTGTTSTTSSIVMDGPHTVQAVWQTDYTLAYITSSVILAVAVVGAFFLLRKRSGKPSR